jgi:hypothetical protein
LIYSFRYDDDSFADDDVPMNKGMDTRQTRRRSTSSQPEIDPSKIPANIKDFLKPPRKNRKKNRDWQPQLSRTCCELEEEQLKLSKEEIKQDLNNILGGVGKALGIGRPISITTLRKAKTTDNA